jgi:hypothetical protein
MNKKISCDSPLKCDRCGLVFVKMSTYNVHINKKHLCKISDESNKPTKNAVDPNLVLQLELAKINLELMKINLERDKINFEKSTIGQEQIKKAMIKENLDSDNDVTDYSIKKETKIDNDIENKVIKNKFVNETVISDNDSSEGEEVDEIETVRIMEKYGLVNTPAQNKPKIDEVSQKHKEFSNKLIKGLAVKNSKTGMGDFTDLLKFEMERASANRPWQKYEINRKKADTSSEVKCLIQFGLDGYLQKKLDDALNYTIKKNLSDNPVSSKFIFYNKETDTFYKLGISASALLANKKERELIPITFEPYYSNKFSEYLNGVIMGVYENYLIAKPERTWQDFKGTKEMYETLGNAIKDRYVFDEKLIKECAVAVFSPKEEDY